MQLPHAALGTTFSPSFLILRTYAQLYPVLEKDLAYSKYQALLCDAIHDNWHPLPGAIATPSTLKHVAFGGRGQ